jgi:hypothetical protein
MEQKILEYIDDIDVRRELGLKPRRLSRLQLKSLETPRQGIVWSPFTKTLYNFRPEGYHTVMKPVNLDISLDGLYIFNLYEQTYELAKYCDNGSFMISSATSSWVTEYEPTFSIL